MSTETLQSAAAGEEAAAEAVVERFQSQLIAFARRQGADDPEGAAQAALQATFHRMHRMDRLSDDSVRAYLYRIVRRSVAKEQRLRRQHGRAAAYDEGLDPNAVGVGPGAIPGVEGQVVDRVTIDRILEQLSPRDREVVTRHFLLDQNYEQIASDLGLQPSTARKVGSRALGRVRRIAIAAGMAGLAIIAIVAIGNAVRGDGPSIDTSPADEGTETEQDSQLPDRGGVVVDGEQSSPEREPSPDSNPEADLGFEAEREGDAAVPRASAEAEPAADVAPEGGADVGRSDTIDSDAGGSDAPDSDAGGSDAPDSDVDGGDTPDSEVDGGDVTDADADGGDVTGGEVRPAAGVVRLTFEHSGKCLEVATGSVADGANAQQWDCLDVGQQRLEIIPIADGAFSLRAIHSAKCLGFTGSNPVAGANIQQWTCTGGADQQFRWQGSSLISVLGELCVTQDGAGQGNGGNVSLWPCLDVPEQRIVDLPGPAKAPGRGPTSGFTRLVVEHSNLCVEVTDASIADGANVLQNTCDDGPQQEFEIVPFSNGVFSLRAVHSGKCLDATGWGRSEGTNLQQWECTGGGSQHFRWQGSSLAYVGSGLCIDVDYGSREVGANVQLWSCVDVPQQRFLV